MLNLRACAVDASAISGHGLTPDNFTCQGESAPLNGLNRLCTKLSNPII